MNSSPTNTFFMIDYERGDLDAARRRAETLIDLGEKLREGSEAPFARALAGLCDFAFDDESQDLDAAIEELRVVDAKHRLAYALTRAALIELERDRPESAVKRAVESLDHARALDRVTEEMLARVALATAYRELNDEAQAVGQIERIAGLMDAPIAGWAKRRATILVARN